MDLIDGGGEAGELARWDIAMQFVELVRNKNFFGWTTFSQISLNRIILWVLLRGRNF